MIHLKKSRATATFFAACVMSFCSSAQAIDGITSLPRPEEVKFASIGFYGLHIDTYAPVSQAQIFRSGCNYVTEIGSKENLELIRILEDGVTFSDKGAHRFRLRTVINLHLQDRSVFTMLISDAGNKTPGVFGTVDNERQDAQGFLLSDLEMLKTLRTWASKNLQPRELNNHCQI